MGAVGAFWISPSTVCFLQDAVKTVLLDNSWSPPEYLGGELLELNASRLVLRFEAGRLASMSGAPTSR